MPCAGTPGASASPWRHSRLWRVSSRLLGLRLIVRFVLGIRIAAQRFGSHQQPGEHRTQCDRIKGFEPRARAAVDLGSAPQHPPTRAAPVFHRCRRRAGQRWDQRQPDPAYRGRGLLPAHQAGAARSPVAHGSPHVRASGWCRVRVSRGGSSNCELNEIFLGTERALQPGKFDASVADS